MAFSSALFWGVFVSLLARDVGFPELASVHVRMLFLKPGMDQGEVESVLQLGRRFPSCGYGNLRWYYREYELRGDHRLTLHYRTTPQGEWRLHEAALARGQKTVLRVSAPRAMQAGEERGIPPQLIEDAVRALQQQKVPGSKPEPER